MKRIPTHRIKNKATFYAKLTRSNWSPIIQPSSTGDSYWSKLFEYFPEYQLFFENESGEWLGFANTIPANFNSPIQNLPDEGWDWLIATGINGFEQDSKPNVLGGLQIGVNPNFRGQGLSKVILEKAKMLMNMQHLKYFILPIRPTLKDKHPEISMEEYMNWKNDEGKIYDPWIRTHLNSGASIIRVCHKAMTVVGSVSDWRIWTGYNFHKSGHYAVPGGLSLVDIDIEKDIGKYEEPNIWILYE